MKMFVSDGAGLPGRCSGAEGIADGKKPSVVFESCREVFMSTFDSLAAKWIRFVRGRQKRNEQCLRRKKQAHLEQ